MPLLAGGGIGGGVAVLLTLEVAVEPDRRGGGGWIGVLLLLSEGAGEAFCAARLGAGRGGGGPVVEDLLLALLGERSVLGLGAGLGGAGLRRVCFIV